MRFDHLLNWVPHREQALAAMQEAGFHAVMGGEHPNWGTHNALSHFGLPYIELIAVQRPEQIPFAAEHIVRDHDRLTALGGGAVTFAVAVPDLGRAVADLRGQGFAVGEPEAGSRVRPDGTTLRWRTAPILDGPAWRPFLIQWEQSDPDRLADLQARGIDSTHANGAVQFDHLVIETGDPLSDSAWCARLVSADAVRAGELWRVPLQECDLLFQKADDQTKDSRIIRVVMRGATAATFELNGLNLAIQPQF